MQSVSTSWQDTAKKRAHGIRKRTLALTIDRNGCYLSQALSSAEILATLYTQVLNLGLSLAPDIPPPLKGVPGHGVHFGEGADYNGPRSAEFDRFLISPAHYAVAIYAALVEAGRMAPEGLAQFNTDGSTVEMIGAEHSPGFELTTGSFGQAISQAGGIALAKKLRGESSRVFVYMSDGELEEGQTWEGVQALAFYKLDNVIVYVDVNGQQVDGYTRDVMNIEPIDARLEGFGATAIKVNGHDVDALADAINKKEKNKPLFVLCYTNPAEGIPMLEKRKPHLHFVRFKTDEELSEAKAFLADMETV